MVSFGPPSPFSALPPEDLLPGLHLNAFRGEPAISEFDWHFTSTHSSSSNFAPLNGSDLHLDIIEASPWPWVAHSVSGQIPATFPPKTENALFGLAFAMAPQVSLLNRATKIYSPAHSSIGTPSSLQGRTPTVCRHAVSGTFNSPSGVLFHLSLTVLLHYRSLGVFSFGKWSSRLPTGFLVSRGTQEHRSGRSFLFRVRGYHSLWRPFPGSFR